MNIFKVLVNSVAIPFLVASPLLTVQAKSGVANASQALPAVTGPIPVTPTSRPLLGAQVALEPYDYVEDEYLLTGDSHTYDWNESGRGIKVIAGPGKYVTRILVRRPRDAKRFSGNVEVTVLNASANVDFGGPTDFASMVRQGDVWIGMTTKAVTGNALKKFDPARYAAIDWSNPAPPAQRCPNPTMIPPYMAGGKDVLEAMARAGLKSSWPEYEDGLVWDMLGQLGLLLKSEQRSAILPGFSKPWVFMTGVSQSSIYIRTWIAGFHNYYRTADGKPVYDGYLGIVGPAMIRINQCAKDVPLEDPSQKLKTPEVPFISISSEGEMWQARHTHQADSFSRKGGIVTYEVAGASHMSAEVPGRAPDKISFAPIPDMIKAGLQMPAAPSGPSLIPPGSRPNDFAWLPFQRAAYHNLQLWARQGIRPPQAAGIQIDGKSEVQRDVRGNALGGLRMPYIDAPTAAHTGYLTAGGMGGVSGAKKQFTPQELKVLYPDHSAYVASFNAATDRLLKGRWILAEDAEALKKAAAAASVPEAPKP